MRPSLARLSQALPPPSLRPSLAVLLVGIVAVATVLVSAALGILEGKQHTLNSSRTTLEGLNFALAGQMDQALQSAHLVLLDTVRLAAVHAGKESLRSEALHLQLRGLIAGLPHIRGLAIADAQGDIQNDSFVFPLSRINVADREHFIAARQSPAERAHISVPHKSRVDKEWTMVMSRPVQGPAGTFLGTVFARIDTSYFEKAFRTALNAPGAAVGVLRHEGTLMFRYPRLEEAIGRSMAATNPVFRDRLLLGAKRVFYEVDQAVDGARRIGSFVALDAFPLVVIVSMDRELLLAAWRRDAFREVLAALFAAAVLLYLVSRLSRSIAGHEANASRIARNEERLRFLTENMSDIVWSADDRLRLTYISPSVERIRGYTVAEALLQSPAEVMAPDSLSLVRKIFRATVKTVHESGIRGRHSFNVEVEQRCKDGSMVWMEESICLIFGEGGKFAGMQGVARPIAERKHLEDKLRRLASLDDLTGLANRRTFLASLDREVIRSQRYGRPLAVLMLDIDHFKVINDRYGHPAGDEALRRFSSVCQQVVRNNDLLGRMGGEEFAACLPETTLDGACEMAERLRLAAADLQLSCEGAAFRLTISIGVASLHDNEVCEQLLGRADKALYAAKQGGRNRVIRETALPH